MTTRKKAHFFFKSISDYPNNYPNKHLHLVNMGYERCQPKYQFSNSFNYYRIYIVKSGSGILTIDNNSTYKLSQHDAFLIRPNQLITKKADSHMPWEYCFFAFNGDLSSGIIERTYFQNNGCVYKLNDNTLAQLIIEASQKMEACDISEFFGLEQLFRFLRQLTPAEKEESALSSKTMSLSQKHFYTAQEYIEMNYYKPIQIDEICQISNVSRSYLFRIFEKYTASNVTDYLANVRLKHAKELLLTTDYSTATIAQLVGYINPTSFYRMFKRVENVTPSQWRNFHRNHTNTQEITITK